MKCLSKHLTALRTLKARCAVLISVGCLSVPTVGFATSTPASPEPATGWQTKTEITTARFMAVTAHPKATDAALLILSEGGTAVDAAIAAQLVLNLVEPQSSGIGGGAFMLYWDAKKREMTSIDGRETAPLAAQDDYFEDGSGGLVKWQDARAGARAVGVPGTLRLLESAHERFGSVEWKRLFAPAIKIAEDGFPVSARLAKSIDGAATLLRRSAPTREYFFTPDDAPLPEGHWLKNPEFLKNSGRRGALMTAEDLSEYRAMLRPPVCAPYRTVVVCGMGPPSSGALTVGQILGLLEGFDLASPDAKSIHLIAEASRLAYADRAKYMADADFVAVPTQGLLDRNYLNQRSGLIETEKSMGKATPGSPPGGPLALSSMRQPEAAGTSHISIVDQYGSVVSMTTTIESGFGSGLMAGGFLLNNEMTDFSFKSETQGNPIANRVEGGKRPRSSMAPTIVLDTRGEPLLVAGSPGGSRIICYVTQALISILDWGMTPQTAVSMPHFCNRNGPTELEAGKDTEALRTALETLGHEVREQEMNSGLHIIPRRPDSRLSAGIDPRREGTAAGE